MRAARGAAVRAAATARAWVVVRGALGRQGAPSSLAALRRALVAAGKPFAEVVASELTPARVAALAASAAGAGRAWAQVACPRLSIDWGPGFSPVPVLSPYEAMVALGAAPAWWAGGGEGGGDVAPAARAARPAAFDLATGDPADGHYPMDFYAADGGPWAATRVRPKPKQRDGVPAAGV
jgi:2-(3-amino-3-carboxypropyl)histidine synthase